MGAAVATLRARDTVWRAWWGIAIAVGLTLIVWLRRPEALLRPDLFADDGPMYQHALAGGSLLEPYAGYLVIVNRVVMAIAALVPPLYTPFVTNAVAVAVTAGVAVLIARRLDPWLALAFVLVPGTWYALGTMVDIQWVLGVYLFVVLAKPAKWDAIGVAIVALQGPVALLLLPLFAVRWWVSRETWPILFAVVLGSAAQLAVILTGPGRHMSGDYAGILDALALRGFIVPIVGTGLGPMLPAILAVAIAGLLGLTVWRLRAYGLAYAWAVFVAAGLLVSPYPSTTHVNDIGLTERYYFLPAVAIAAVIVLGVRRRVPAAYALVPLLAIGMLGDLRLPALTGTWVTDSACIGGPVPCVIPVVGGGPGWDVVYTP